MDMVCVPPGKKCPLIASLFALLALALPLPAQVAASTCGRLLTEPDYDLELPLIGPIRDQCGGTCWISAGLTMVEHSVHAQSGVKVAMSEDYLAAMELKNQALGGVMNRTNAVPALAGRTFSHVEWLIREYGMVPKSEFTAPDADWAKIGEALYAVTKSYAAKKTLTNAEYERLSKELDAALSKELAPLPANFRIAGKRFTPKTFSTAFIPNHSFKTLFLKEKGVPDPLGLHHSLKDVLTQVKQSIADGKAVYASIRWPEEWFSIQNGLLNLDTNPATAKKVKSSGLHAVAVVGAKLDSKGEITALKIQNSWGEELGDEGFFHISRKTLEQVLQYVVVGN
ncbi:MAG: hypothetical protein HY074_17990 [Deltaproteobacteria bacterium]|nr:hypothetical protein [Deltaproteobacteria bacterium]